MVIDLPWALQKNRKLNRLDELEKELNEIKSNNKGLLDETNTANEGCPEVTAIIYPDDSNIQLQEVKKELGSNQVEEIKSNRTDTISMDTLTKLNNTFQKVMFRLYLDLSEMMFR